MAGVATAPAPTPVQRPQEKAPQRTAHSSAIGHGLGLGGNGALWAFGTYGWGWAAAIGGATVVGMGAKHLRNRRRSGRGGGLFGGGRGGGSRGGLLGRLGGRGRSGGGMGLGRGRSRSGGLGTRAGRSGSGFLGKLAGKRSSTPKGGGGLLSRGASGRGSLGRGKKGVGLLGAGRGGSGSRPGSSRGRSDGLLGGSRGTRRGAGSGRGLGSGRGAGSSGGKGRGRGLMSRLNPFSRNRGGATKGSGIGRGSRNAANRLLRKLNPFNRKKNPPRTKKQQQQNGTPPSGWQEAPLNPKNTDWKDRTMGNAPARRRVPAPGASKGGTGGGGITQAAEQFAGTLAKPPREVNTLKNFDADLGDLAGAVEALQGGMKNHAAIVEAGMPAERAAHEEMRRITQQFGQAAEALKVLQAEQRRRNALDHERVDNGRPNEQGYDWKSNQQ